MYKSIETQVVNNRKSVYKEARKPFNSINHDVVFTDHDVVYTDHAVVYTTHGDDLRIKALPIKNISA